MSGFSYVLPQELTIYEVEETYQELCLAIQDHDFVQLDCQHLIELDTAGFQLLVWYLSQPDVSESGVNIFNVPLFLEQQMALFSIKTLQSVG
ncbi:STAS domain-containing protein [Vibrio aquaticus]|uniref:STAS domain-containing protein n=1 Tax=Vibrio aquaticus TaxID=2496559 RepID=A0A3S0V3M0_9VIBR|nr:STAS domain-containing protein [Vibrio aquaticus]RTZ16576.1 STAS domain-containing protein [Vibrio aquaticus]